MASGHRVFTVTCDDEEDEDDNGDIDNQYNNVGYNDNIISDNICNNKEEGGGGSRNNARIDDTEGVGNISWSNCLRVFRYELYDCVYSNMQYQEFYEVDV
eukprot:TRINITY_DN27879_c0_g1_i1.p4 TRINITY_DN27879_c0_g1~~TRINITY_DN27879_c0_g1_i1.p4  ORF type:complete len:100 (-),score=24.44 TRINITY_DN27879_c0_g1_i1:56-355(-)